MRFAKAMLTGLVLVSPVVAGAEGPEQLDQLEPGADEWQAEYFGTLGNGSSREHSVEVMFGVSDRVAMGVEIQAQYAHGELELDTVGAKALYRFTGEDAPVAIGLQVQFGFGAKAVLAEAEARLIVATRNRAWWAQSNVMLRRSREAGGATTGLAYAASVQHSLGRFSWLGIEASGQSTPFWRDAAATGEHGHFAGPALTFNWRPSRGHEVEVGLAYLRRIGGEGSANSGRLFVQLSF